MPGGLAAQAEAAFLHGGVHVAVAHGRAQQRDAALGEQAQRDVVVGLGARDNVVAELKKGKRVGSKKYKVHLDGYNILPLLGGETKEGPRKEIFYFSDDGDLTALRYNDWKVIFLEQRAEATFQAWMEPFVPLRVPLIFNLRRDPYERAQITSNTYFDWLLDRAWVLVPAQAYVAEMLQTFVEFPPRQEPASFNLANVMEKLTSGISSA